MPARELAFDGADELALHAPKASQGRCGTPLKQTPKNARVNRISESETDPRSRAIAVLRFSPRQGAPCCQFSPAWLDLNPAYKDAVRTATTAYPAPPSKEQVRGILVSVAGQLGLSPAFTCRSDALMEHFLICHLRLSAAQLPEIVPIPITRSFINSHHPYLRFNTASKCQEFNLEIGDAAVPVNYSKGRATLLNSVLDGNGNMRRPR